MKLSQGCCCRWLACVALLVLGAVSVTQSAAESFGTKIEAGGRECYTEVVEAGGVLAFNFRVTDGGAFDVDVTMRVLYTPPLKRMADTERVHFNEFFMARRDRLRTKEINTWSRANSGGHSYTAPTALQSKHGLPVEVSVCFDNSFSVVSPKWITFTLMKHDVLEIDPEAINKVDSEMEEYLHGMGKTMFKLAQDTDMLRLTAAADRSRNYSTSYILSGALALNLMVFATMAAYQYWALTNFMRRLRLGGMAQQRPKRVEVVSK